MSRAGRIVLLLLVLCRPGGVAAEPLPVLNWGLTAWPGLVNSQDGKPTDGIVIDLLSQLTRRLPEYQHHLLLMNTSRSLAYLQQSEDLCIVDVQRSAERDRIGYFVGLIINLPPQLVIRRSDLAKIGQGQPRLSLQQLLQRPDLRGGLPAGRIYGPELTPLLQAAEATGRLQRIQSSGRGSNLLQMLEHGRIDYTLEYSETVQLLRHSDEAAAFSADIALLPLTETRTPIMSGIYCPRSPFGKRVIERLDAIAGEPEVLARFAAAMAQFAPPATREHYRQWFDDYLANRAQRSYTNIED